MLQISTGLHLVWTMYFCYNNLIGDPPFWWDYFYLYDDELVVSCYKAQLRLGYTKDVFV